MDQPEPTSKRRTMDGREVSALVQDQCDTGQFVYAEEGTAVHTTEDLTSTSFVITADQQRITVPDLFPGFDERDRLGVVVRSPCGAVGASALILATITAFYDIQRQRARDFFVYPNYFLFHVGGLLGDHKMLDIFPSHKEVVVENSPEDILRAINDRAVTRLLALR